jgi:hypothetical protein
MAKRCGSNGNKSCGMKDGLFNPFFTGNYSNPYSYSGGSSTVELDALYIALLDRASLAGLTAPDTETQQAGSEAIASLSEAGLLTKKIAVYFLFSNTEAREFTKLNWIADQYNLTESILNSLGFSTLGFDGDSTNVLLTGFNPSSAGNALYTQNNAAVSCFVVTNEASTGLDWGAFDGTRQSKLNSRNGSDQRAVHFNDGTNSTVGSETDGRGFHVLFRNSAGTKRSWKNGTQTDISVTSTGLPNEQFAILGRRNAGATDFQSPRTIAYFSIGQAPTSDELAAERRIFAQFYIKSQKPLFFVEDIEDAPTQLVSLGGGGTWDQLALICGPVYHNGTILLYGGSNENNPGNVNQYSIGAFDLTNSYTGTKDAANPIVNRSAVGLGDAGEGIVPHDIYDDGTYYYLVCTVYNSDNTLNLALMRAPKNDPKNFDDYTVILVDGFAAHGARFFEDPDDPTNLYIVYANKALSGSSFRFKTAFAAKSNLLTTWTIEDSDIIASSPANTSQEYCKIWKEGATWYAVYGRFYSVFGTANFSMWTTSSADRSSFTEGKETMIPSGVPSQFDENYRSHYTFDGRTLGTSNTPFYFGGRQGLSNANYIGIGVKHIRRRP